MPFPCSKFKSILDSFHISYLISKGNNIFLCNQIDHTTAIQTTHDSLFGFFPVMLPRCCQKWSIQSTGCCTRFPKQIYNQTSGVQLIPHVHYRTHNLTNFPLVWFSSCTDCPSLVFFPIPNTIFQTKALTFEGTGAFLRVLKFFASCTSPQECNLSQTFFYHTIVVGLSHQIHSSLASFFGLFSPIWSHIDEKTSIEVKYISWF